MICKIQPVSFLKGTVQLPASKSYSIRAFIIAACGGISQIRYPSDCDDAKVAIQAARKLGADVISLKSNKWRIAAKAHLPKLSKINVGESGTVLRFLLPLAAIYGKKAVIDGEGTLKGRPNSFLTRTLRSMGIEIHGTGEKESIPIHILGGIFYGKKFEIEGSLSSQFISALLIACPQLNHSTQLTVRGKIVSADYIDMTTQILSKSGISIKKKGRDYFIEGNQKFSGLKNFSVPSDYGLAAFLMAAAILNNSNVSLKGIFADELIQADAHIIHFLKQMNAKFTKTSKVIRIQGPSSLIGGNFSLRNCPDLVPIMAVVALFAKGKTRLYNIAHARVKESDRISDLIFELRKIGAKIEEKSKEMIIYPQEKYKSNCVLNPHRDHRLAMAFAVLGAKIGAIIEDIECTAKSYPSFTRDFKLMGVKI